MRRLRQLAGRFWDYTNGKSIQMTIAASFTLVAVCGMVLMGGLLYNQFAQSMKQTILDENTQLISQIALNINSYNSQMRGISNSMYYSIIKNADISGQSISREMAILYEANVDSLVSIALYTEDGELITAAPNSNAKAYVDVKEQDWFVSAISVIENPHFSTPHVQNLFVESTDRYNWVISLSRMVELTEGGEISRGVLLVDMNYARLELIFQQMSENTAGYAYLIDKSGEIIYHPKQQLIYSGLFDENNLSAADYSDGIHQEVFDNTGRQVIVKTLSYTGWKVISVIPNSEFLVTSSQMSILMAAIIGLGIVLVVIFNYLVSWRIANPIKRLDRSVKALEKGVVDLEVYIGGPAEIQNLGRTVQSTVNQIRSLMDDIVIEQENKRKSEFDALQAQINPHFLYNTLDSIIWMIETERNEEAISMVTALASLFRISLSKGKTIIPIRAELQHGMDYLQIQKIRYKNKFTVITEIDPQIEDYFTIKLIIQPLLENAIYHAIELMDGDGEIRITGYMKDGDIYIKVSDNGLGMMPEKVARLLVGDNSDSKKGSGIGLKNVHQRIQLYYGSRYGLEVESEPDEGTMVCIHLPAQTESHLQQEGGSRR